MKFKKLFRNSYFIDAKNSVEGFIDDDVLMLSASISYYAALSFFPLLLILLAGLGGALKFSNTAQTAMDTLLSFINESISPQVGEFVQKILTGIETESVWGGPLGALMLFISAGTIFAQFDEIIRRIWAQSSLGSGPREIIKSILTSRLKAFLIIILLGFFIICLFVAGIIFNASSAMIDLPFLNSFFWRFLNLLIPLIGNFFAFLIIYKYLPPKIIVWRSAAEGALCATLLWFLGQKILTAIAISDQYSAYGVIGAFIALLSWIYVGSAIVFLGAEYTKFRNKRLCDSKGEVLR